MQHSHGEGPFGTKHVTSSPSPAAGNHMSPASNASPLPGMHPKSTGLLPPAGTNSPATGMQLPLGTQMPVSSSASPLHAPAGGFGSTGSISSRLGPPHQQHPFAPSPLHSNASSLMLKPNEVESREKNSMHNVPQPPPIMNGYLPSFVSTSAQSTSTSGASRISPHQNVVNIPATTPGSGLPPPPPHLSAANNSKSSLAVSTCASLHSLSAPPPPTSTTMASAKIAHSNSGNIPLIQNSAAGFVPGGLPPGLPPGVAPPPGMLSGALGPNGISPMLLHTSPYRPPYSNYPLYAPYSSLPHSPYLPPAVPSPSASPRTSRESPMMTQIGKTSGIRPPTPVSQPSVSVPCQLPAPANNNNGGVSITSSAVISSVSTAAPAHTSLTTTGSLSNPLQTGLPPTSVAPHLLHHPHLPYPTSLQLTQPILSAPPNLPPPSVGHSHTIANVTTTTSAVTPLSASLSSGNSIPSSSLNRDGPQLLPPPPPHLLTHPHLTQPHIPPIPSHMLPPHPALLRGASPTTVNNGNHSTTIGGVHTTLSNTTMASSSSSSSSVIHKVISPKSESPSKERNDVSYR